MMMKLIEGALILSLLGIGTGKQTYIPCGQPTGCYCTAPILHQIQCTNITVFPIFEDVIKPGVVSIVFHQSQIVGLPPFPQDSWIKLQQLAFIDTPSMPCSAIAELKRPGLRILSECIAKEEECPAQDCPKCPKQVVCPETRERTIFLTAILIFVILLVSWLGLVVYFLYFYKRECWTAPRTAMTDEEATRQTWV